jgi:hypothetical protein
VAKSASAYVFEGIGEEMGKVHKGEGVPFVPLEFTMRIGASYGWARMAKRPWSTRPMYSHGIKRAGELEKATIPRNAPPINWGLCSSTMSGG